MAKLIGRSIGDQPAMVIELKPGVSRFGRAPENDHILDESLISFVHCEILVDNEFLFVRDLESTNGTFIDGKRVIESALYGGQILRMGPVEFLVDAPMPKIALPELPKPMEAEVEIPVPPLADGYAACPGHHTRHAVWECTFCKSVFCDECVRKLRRVGGVHLKLCKKCSNPCQLTPWSEMMRGKKKGIFGKIVGKIKDGLTKQTTRQLP